MNGRKGKNARDVSPAGQHSDWGSVSSVGGCSRNGGAGAVSHRASSLTRLFIISTCSSPHGRRAADGGRAGQPTYHQQVAPGVKIGHVHHRDTVGGRLGRRQSAGNDKEDRNRSGHARPQRPPRAGHAGQHPRGRTPDCIGSAQP